MGTGDGTFAYRMAKTQPDTLVIGVDSNIENLREISRKASLKPAKGGLGNVLFGQLPLEQAPGELIGLADSISVILPWGTLLRAVALPETESLQKLAALCKPRAKVTLLFGYGSQDQNIVQSLGLPALGDTNCLGSLYSTLYRDAGFDVKFQNIPLEIVRDLPSSWAKKLAYSGKNRIFVKAEGRIARRTSEELC